MLSQNSRPTEGEVNNTGLLSLSVSRLLCNARRPSQGEKKQTGKAITSCLFAQNQKPVEAYWCLRLNLCSGLKTPASLFSLLPASLPFSLPVTSCPTGASRDEREIRKEVSGKPGYRGNGAEADVVIERRAQIWKTESVQTEKWRETGIEISKKGQEKTEAE